MNEKITLTTIQEYDGDCNAFETVQRYCEMEPLDSEYDINDDGDCKIIYECNKSDKRQITEALDASDGVKSYVWK